MISREQVEQLEKEWQENPRWKGVKRPYSAADVLRLRGSIQVEHTMARMGAERLWHLLHEEDYVNALGAMTGNQAVATAARTRESGVHVALFVHSPSSTA